MIKKIAIALLVLVILLVVAAALGLPYYLNDLVRSGIERVGPEVTGTRVSVEAVELSPFSGSGSISSLVIANPEGFETDGALKIGEAHVRLVPQSLMDDTIRIREIEIDGVELTYELSARGSNLARIREHIETILGSEPSAGETRVIIDRFALRNCTVRLSATLFKGKTKNETLPTIELTDIGKKSGGVTAAEAAAQILQPVLAKAAEVAATNGITEPAATIQETIKSKFQKLLNR